jgi:hypothetical protein
MNRDDLIAFARRDWAAAAAAKAAYWADRKRQMSPAAALDLGDVLRRHALAVRPDWPDHNARAADLAAHLRVSEALHATARTHSR